MKRIVILLSSLLILFASCSAEIIGNLPYEEVRTDGETMDVLPVSGTSFSISFKPVPYATGYEYSLNGGASVPLTNITYDGSSYYAVIDVEESGPMTGTIDLFACTSDGSVKNISSTEYVLSLSNVAPDAYLAARNETSAEIRVNTSLPSGMVMYKVVLTDADGSSSQTLNFFSNSFEVTGLSSGSYTAEVSHALVGQEFGAKIMKVEIASYSMDDISTISLDVNENGFIASDIPDGVSAVRLIKYKDASAEGTAVLENIPVEGSIAEVPFTKLRSLETGYFRIESSDGTVKSDVLKCTVPVVNAEVTVNYKSVFVDLDFADDFASRDYGIYVTGASGAQVKVVLGQNDRVTISNLDSNYDYGTLVLNFRDGNSNVTSCPIENVFTKSFVGTYYWYRTAGSGPENFIIDVEDKADGSKYPYYVYFNKADQAVSGIAGYGENDDSRLRIMPLVDIAAGDPDPSGVIVNVNAPPAGFSSANSAYSTNGGKWNKLKDTMSPVSWMIDTNVSNSSGDVVFTSTLSAVSSGTSPSFNTETTFSFMEVTIDGNVIPVVKFKNIGGGGLMGMLVNSGLYKNEAPQSALFGDSGEKDKKNCWYLVKAEDLEAVR